MTSTRNDPLPRVPFAMLSALPLRRWHWAQLAREVSWQTLRMNVNALGRHGAWEDGATAQVAADRLGNPEEARSAAASPIQLLTALSQLQGAPECIHQALEAALENSLSNIPAFPGRTWVLLDVSSSMSSPLTGFRRGATSVVRCVDAAALLCAAVMRRNEQVRVLPFAEDARPVAMNPGASLVEVTVMLASMPGGGTDCSAPLRWLNRNRERGDCVLMLSDNQSWMNFTRGHASEFAVQWQVFRRRNREARLACLDLQPYTHAQAPSSGDVLNIGGFSDAVLETIATFFGGQTTDVWVKEIEAVKL